MSLRFRAFAAVLIAGALTLPSAITAGAQSITADQRGEIEKIIREYLLSHPELLQDVMVELEKRQTAAEAEKHRNAVKEHADAIFNSPRQVTLGNPQGDVAVVEFFDYNCGYCKLIAPEVLALIRANPDVRFVFKDMTIFGEASEYAAAGAHLTKAGGKYLDVHRAFMAEKPLEDDDVARILTLNGVSPAAARERQQSAEQRKYLEDQHQLAAALGIQGTPAFVVGDVMIPGADPLALKQAIAAVKQGKSPRIEVHGGASRPAA